MEEAGEMEQALDAAIGRTGQALRTLAGEALSARELAFAPYSRFKVGAAVLTADGRVFRGCNVESAVFPLGNCAERVAIQKAVSEGARDVLAVAVAGDATYLRRAETSADGPGQSGEEGLSRFVTPCGACRQIIFEFGPEASILLVDLQGGWRLTSARELLPGGFRLDGFTG
jgi:cytidine deaminase